MSDQIIHCEHNTSYLQQTAVCLAQYCLERQSANVFDYTKSIQENYHKYALERV